MTPTSTRLRARLEERRRWFTNEWFFKWHFIGNDGPVSIDSFDGRGIHYGGIKFSGTARQVYWDTVVRGVRKEITEQFAWVDDEVRKYTAETALKAIDECAGQLASFAQIIRREAVAKDRILRGDGISFPTENDAGHWGDTGAETIFQHAEALKRALPLVVAPVEDRSLHKRALTAWNENQGWLGPLGLLLAVGGLLIPFVF